MSTDVLGSMAVVIGANTQAFETGLDKAARKAGSFSSAMGKIKNVNLSGQTRPLQQQAGIFERLENRANLYRKALQRATDENTIGKLNTKLAQTNAEMARLRTLSSSAATGMNKVSGGASQVNTEFSRLISDAPYAYNNLGAIGNNLSQVAENFARLKAEAGSGRAALSAAISSMLTPMGLLTVGIAAVTAGFTIYQMWQQKAGKATKEKVSALQAAKKASDEYKASLSSLNRASLTGAQDAQKEIVSLRILYKATQDTTLSMENRLKAVNEIQNQYPSYFEGFSKEEVLAGKASEAYDKLSKSILATARARAAQELIAEKARQQLENEQKIADLNAERLRAKEEAKRRAANASKTSINGGSASGGAIAGAIAIDAQKQQEKINDIIRERTNLQKANTKLGEEMLQLEKEVFNQIKAGAEIGSQDTAKDKEKLSILQQLIKDFNNANDQATLFGDSYALASEKAGLLETAIKALIDEGLSPQGKLLTTLTRQWQDFRTMAEMPKLESKQASIEFKTITPDIDWTKRYFEVHSKMVEANRMGIQSNLAFGDSFSLAASNVGVLENGISSLLENGFSALSPQVQKLVEQLKQAKMELQWEETISSLEANIEKLTEGVFVSLGQELGNVFAGLNSGPDALEAWGKTVISSLGAVMSQFGQEMIALGIGKMALDSMFTMPGGGAIAIAAGTALVAAGSALSASMSKSVGSLPGGSGLGSGISGTGGFRPSADMNRGPEELITRIKGEDIEVVMQRFNYKKGRVRG